MLVVIVVTTVVSSGLAYRSLNPSSVEPFFAVWVLGNGGLLQNYFPNNNTSLRANETLTWTIGVYNHMGSLEYVALQVKLLNSSDTGPNDISASGTPALVEFDRVLTENETWTTPFIWEISRINQADGATKVTELTVNGRVVSVPLAEAADGLNFRLVFELWYYDETSNSLAFSWQSSAGIRTSWVQVWFNTTLV